MEAVWGICNQGDFFWGVSFYQIPSFQSNVWKRSYAACGKKDVLSSGFGRLLADLDRVKSPGVKSHQLPPPEDGLKIIERDGLEEFIWNDSRGLSRKMQDSHHSPRLFFYYSKWAIRDPGDSGDCRAPGLWLHLFVCWNDTSWRWLCGSHVRCGCRGIGEVASAGGFFDVPTPTPVGGGFLGFWGVDGNSPKWRV